MSAGDTTATGTHLRDAAVNPATGDFLEPINAGSQDPQGPLCVSPEIHGTQGVHPVTPGAVSATAATQDTAEKAHVGDFVEGV